MPGGSQLTSRCWPPSSSGEENWGTHRLESRRHLSRSRVSGVIGSCWRTVVSMKLLRRGNKRHVWLPTNRSTCARNVTSFTSLVGSRVRTSVEPVETIHSAGFGWVSSCRIRPPSRSDLTGYCNPTLCWNELRRGNVEPAVADRWGPGCWLHRPRKQGAFDSLPL